MKKTILIIDNYDSFTYNLSHIISKQIKNTCIIIKRNQDLSLKTIQADALVISPGPMTPRKSGLCFKMIKKYQKKPILGICLGMQMINEFFKGKTKPSKIPTHGSQVKVSHQKSLLFTKVPQVFLACRYNSLCANPLSTSLKATAFSQKEVMVLEHPTHPIVGIQFHPESFLTPFGFKIIKNFFTYYAKDFFS